MENLSIEQIRVFDEEMANRMSFIEKEDTGDDYVEAVELLCETLQRLGFHLTVCEFRRIKNDYLMPLRRSETWNPGIYER